MFSAQAWHWVAPELRYVRAREALADGGLLAVFWSRPDWERCDAARPAARRLRAPAADFGPDPGPMHPGSEIAPDRWEDWDAEIAAAAGLDDPRTRYYEWNAEYTAQRYLELIAISHDHMLLPDADREALLTAVGDVIDDTVARLSLHCVTKLCLARARGRRCGGGDNERRRNRARRRRRRPLLVGRLDPRLPRLPRHRMGDSRVDDDIGLFEKLCLEAFQSGLSWLTILRKREDVPPRVQGL